MEYCLVRRAVGAVTVDGPDADRDPEQIKVHGNVTFTPMLKQGDIIQYAGPTGPVSIVPQPIEVRISDGVILHRGQEGVKLLAGGAGMQPDIIRWKATFSNMQAGGWAFTLKPVIFDAVPGGEVDLTLVAPLAGASEPILRGPAGVGLEDLVVDGSELVVIVRSEAGVHELKRIPLEDVVRAEADAAAVVAADAVRQEVADDADRAENAASTAQGIATSLPATISTEIDTQLPGKLDPELDERVPPKVADAIAADRTVADAAAAAVSDAVVGLDLMERTTAEDLIEAGRWYRGALGSADLDMVTAPGTYDQGNTGYPSPGRNYPENSTGVLIVSKLGTANIAQVYVARTGAVWTRMTTNSGTVWPQWERTARISEVADLESRVLLVEGALERVNLNDVKTPGLYHQSFPDLPTVERNYPENSTGTLLVTPLGSTNIAQVYVARTGAVWTRMTTNAGTIWPQWERSGGTGGPVSLVEELPPSTSWETARSLTTYDQGERFLDSMVDQLPGVSLVELGESGQGRPIRGMYVGDTTKPTVILECAIHGDENSGREAAFIWAKEVAKSVPSWMDHICFLIIPTANPDSVNIRRGNGFGTDINRSWINQSTSEVRALTGAVDSVNPVFYLSMHEKVDRAWEVELGGNHYPWREGEPHHTVSETVHGAVLSALSEIEPKTRDYGFKMVETDEPATGRAYLGETRNIPVLLVEIGSYNGPGSWAESVPHPNRFRAPMDKRIKHCIAIFDTVANTMAEIVSGEPLAVTSKTSYPDTPAHEHTAAQITDLHHYSGTGFPEGKVTAPVGATYTDTAATNGAVRWIKTSGTGTTGWRVEYGDTGWRNITTQSDVATSGDIFIRRHGETIFLVFDDVQLSSRGPWQKLVQIPNGFKTAIRIDHRPTVYTETTTLIMNYEVGQYRSTGHESSSDPLVFRDMWLTSDSWPSTLPGIPA